MTNDELLAKSIELLASGPELGTSTRYWGDSCQNEILRRKRREERRADVALRQEALKGLSDDDLYAEYKSATRAMTEISDEWYYMVPPSSRRQIANRYEAVEAEELRRYDAKVARDHQQR